MLSALALSLLLSWVQVRSDTYVVKSAAGEERAKRVLAELESFHQLVGTLVFEKSVLPELPIEVLLIADHQMMKELAPEYNGRKTGVAAYYQRGEDRDFIVLSGRIFPQTLTRIVYHELTHYFLSRALEGRPTWLNEGLAEYFATAEIDEEEIYLGALQPERMQLLKTTRLIPLREFFAIDQRSRYYNESFKANLFYAQAWAFVHYMMHGEHAEGFKRYIEALSEGEASLLDYLNISETDLEFAFGKYVTTFIRHASRQRVETARENWSMNVKSIPEAEAHISIGEVFLANGKYEDARRYLEPLAEPGNEFPRASYSRGILARLFREPGARDWFIDALMDPQLGARAAIQLVRMGELHIPPLRTLLEQAVAAGIRLPDVYWALSELYLDDVRRIQETVRISRNLLAAELLVPATLPAEPARSPYAHGMDQGIKYRLLSASQETPRIEFFVRPYYPPELIAQQLSGEVAMDVQLTPEGRVAGVWLVSAVPDVFGSLATAAVREWRFEAIPTKIRVVLEFTP